MLKYRNIHYLKRRKNNRVRIFSILLFFIVIVVFFVYQYNKMTYRQYTKMYHGYIIREARINSLDPNLVRALIIQESNFNPNVIGSKGELGLMQIKKDTAVKDWCKYNKRPIPPKSVLLDPETNIKIGTWYLAYCKRHWVKYKNWLPLTLAEYNAGYSNAKKWAPASWDGEVIEKITFPSTKEYVKNIIKYYEILQGY